MSKPSQGWSSSTNETEGPSRGGAAGFRLAVLLSGFLVLWFSRTVADPDLWGHVRFGQDMMEDRKLPATDPYSYRTAGSAWINHEWLSELTFAATFAHAGSTGLILLKLLIAGAVLGLAHRSLRRGGLPPAPAALMVAVASIPFHFGMGTVRPQLFTYLGFAVLLSMLAGAGARAPGRLWSLPLLFAAWVNLHGGVLAGVGILGVWLAIRLVERPRSRDELAGPVPVAPFRLGVIGLACGAGLMLNPYGPGLLVFLLRTTLVARPEITEWGPMNFWSLPGVVFLLLATVAALGLCRGRRAGKADAAAFIALTGVLAALSNRHYPLFALAAMISGGAHLADAWNGSPLDRLSGVGRGRVFAVLAPAAFALLVAASLPRLWCIRIEAFHFAYPARAVALLKAARFEGNIAVPFDWGEFVLWQLGPAGKVSVDGRRETVYSDEAYRRALDFERGTGDPDAFLRTARTDLVLVRNGAAPAVRLAGDPGWVPLYQDTFCVLFARAGLPAIGRIAATPVPNLPDDGDGLCFPAAARPEADPFREVPARRPGGDRGPSGSVPAGPGPARPRS
jgi:hypothetical protein